MEKPKFKNHALSEDFNVILDNISDIGKGKMGNKETINIDLKIGEINEYNDYLYNNVNDRDDDFNELEKNI